MNDVIIVGGGVSGCSILYSLSRFKGKFTLLEKANDVAFGATKANSGICHAGYDPKTGTKMAIHNVRGNELIHKYHSDLGFSFYPTGSLVVAFDADEKLKLKELLERGIANGVPDLKIVEGDELFAIEPNLSRKAVAALYAKTAGIVDPWGMCYAQSECAILGGAKVERETEVTDIKKVDDHFVISTNKGKYKAKYVINAAGTYSDAISRMVEPAHFEIVPKKGEYYLLDTTQGDIVNTVVFQCPSKAGKGVLIAPTTHGNIIVGPDSQSATKEDNNTTVDGLHYISERAYMSVPSIDLSANVRYFAGVRGNSDKDDYIIGESKTCKNFFNVAGICSPGLTSAMSIAIEVVDLLIGAGLSSEKNPNFVTKRPKDKFKSLSLAEKNKLIAEKPEYGRIVCRCRQVTEGEVLFALGSALPPRSLEAVKRRVAAGNGRCQAGYCSPRVVSILAKHYGIAETEVPYDRVGTYIVDGEIIENNDKV